MEVHKENSESDINAERGGLWKQLKCIMSLRVTRAEQVGRPALAVVVGVRCINWNPPEQRSRGTVLRIEEEASVEALSRDKAGMF